MNDAETLYFGRLEAKIAAAERLYLEHGTRLKSDPGVAAALAELELRLDALQLAMSEAGFGSLCSACASTEPGGCCDASIAEEAYSLLLLVNRLLGVELQRQNPWPACCVFVGRTGWIPRAKPSICWNYNCRHIHQTLPRADVERVEKLVGQALQQLLVAEERASLTLGGPTTPVRPAA